MFVEIVSAAHKNQHHLRRLAHEERVVFGVKGITLDKERKQVTSQPYVSSPDEIRTDLVAQITKAINKKANKSYPANTVLIVSCTPDTIVDNDEWSDVVDQLHSLPAVGSFSEVFVYDIVGSRSASLYRSQNPSP